jgi:HSP20 family molecular chaperone IbpA
MAEVVHRTRNALPDLLEWMDRGLPPFVERWAERGAQAIRVEERMRDGRLVVRAELPGIDPERDVEVALQGDRLTITAERREEEHTESGHGYRSEFRYGSSTRTLQVPPGTQESDISASYADGILEITVPAPTPQREPRRIPVRHGGTP